jgi:flavin reductase (DIM6/NTAB) family NADH-FMN oxidoreductase RutF
MNSFKEILPYELTSNPFTMIGKDWMLVSAADSTDKALFGKNYNTMTASWGGVGVLWNKPVAFVFIRPERNTYLFTEDSEHMTLSFFGGEMRDALTFCGRNSGRDVDKAEKCGLTPVFEAEAHGRSVYFEEASCVLKVRRLYGDSIKTDKFYDEAPLDFYRTDGLHKMYVCEIEKVLVK